LWLAVVVALICRGATAAVAVEVAELSMWLLNLFLLTHLLLLAAVVTEQQVVILPARE
jgi:hypothetical protein